MIKLKTGVFK